MKTVEIINIWVDDTEGQKDWIVSKDTVEEDDPTTSLHTVTEDVCDSYEDAVESGRVIAERYGLPLYCQEDDEWL